MEEEGEAVVGDQVQGGEPDVGELGQDGNFRCELPCKFKTRDSFNLKRHQDKTNCCIRSF